jgi:hypothetical protein
MRPEDLHRLLRQRPFQPFHLHLSNGTAFEIRHPELAMVTRSSVIIGKPAADLPPPVVDDFDIVALFHINHMERLPFGAPPSGN